MRRCLGLALLLTSLPLAVEAAEITVRMAGTNYEPATVQARAGDQIVFVNDDGVDHDVFVPTAGFGVDFGKQAPGATSVLPLAKPGRFEVECVFHAQMHLEVLVVE